MPLLSLTFLFRFWLVQCLIMCAAAGFGRLPAGQADSGVSPASPAGNKRVLTNSSPAALNGCFYQISGRDSWSAERLARELGWMREFGINTIILTSIVVESTAYYPSMLSDLQSTGSDPLRKILSEADAHGMDIHVMVYDTQHWTTTSVEFHDMLTSKVCAIATDLYDQYGRHPSLKGFYLIPEFWHPAPESLRRVWVEHYLRTVTRHIKSLDERLMISCAPFAGVESRYDAEAFEQFWTSLLRDAPGLDTLIFQDGIGANEYIDTDTKGRSFAYIHDLYVRMRRACEATSRTLWADVEAFEAVGCGYPPHISRMADQLAVVAPLAARNIAFEWAYLSPGSSTAAVEFLANYRRYLAGRPLIENVAKNRPYAFSSPPMPAYPDAGMKLTDGGREGAEQKNYVGWENQSRVEVTIELGRTRRGLCGFAASFLNSAAINCAGPASLSVSISTDGSRFIPIGRFPPPFSCDEGGPNVYEMKTTAPAEARYVRFEAEARPGGSRLLAGEMAVFSAVPEHVSRGKRYAYSCEPSSQHPDETFKLTNGDESPRWYAQAGWQDLAGDLVVTIDLESVHKLTTARASFLNNESQGVKLPDAVKVQTSMDAHAFSPLVQLVNESRRDNACNAYSATAGAKARYVRFVIKPSAGWLMLNELTVIAE
ncbi:MAG: DUF4434 domain-containing protein [Candidatus Sumerlaeota bacterium]|nr:DUF4434 domain-containing protein [Candidatus Sumerlaeota bacterium]